MNHRDAEISELIVVIKEECCGNLNDAAAQMTSLGFEVFSIDPDEGVINGSIEAYKQPQLEKLDCINYVRSVDTYIADFPVGDPRDLDLAKDEDEEDAV